VLALLSMSGAGGGAGLRWRCRLAGLRTLWSTEKCGGSRNLGSLLLDRHCRALASAAARWDAGFEAPLNNNTQLASAL